MAKDKIIIYFAGGTMTGVFGAGVAQAFQNNNLYPKIEAIYGASAGTLTAAYFVSKQVSLGSSIYWEDLAKEFISPSGFWIGVWQRFQSKFIKYVFKDKLRDALNIGYLLNVIEKVKILDVEAVKNSPIPIFIKLFNLKEYKIEYFNLQKENTLEIIEASISLFPYVHQTATINGVEYIDAAPIEVIGVKYLREKYPKNKIIVVINSPLKRKWRYKLKNFLEGKFTSWMLNDSKLYQPFMDAENNILKDFSFILSDPNTILISPPEGEYIPTRTINPVILKKFWELGIQAGEKITASI